MCNLFNCFIVYFPFVELAIIIQWL